MCRCCFNDITPSDDNPTLVCPKCGTQNKDAAPPIGLKPMSEYVKASCRSCGEQIEFPVEMCGSVIDCPHCRYKTLLPPANRLTPLSDERFWTDKEGRVTRAKCPRCRRMIKIQGHDGKTAALDYHHSNGGYACNGEFARLV